MANYICLLLDPGCKVSNVEVLRAESDGIATRTAVSLAGQARAWGYELWRRGRQVAAFYDCKHPPARVNVA